MIPLKIAKALHRVLTMANPPEGTSPGVRLISDDGDTLVFAEALNEFSCIQVLFDSTDMEAGDWDVVIPEVELKKFIEDVNYGDPECLDFEEASWPPNVEDALDQAQAVRVPEDVSFWERSGMQLQYLHPIAEALRDLYGHNAKIKIAQGAYGGAISFHVALSDDVDIETTIFLTAYLMWEEERQDPS
mgnify:CR=1 FL=1|jgi:hypothetical protein